MKVVFLDFDGVVVCLPVEWDHLPSGKKVHSLNREAVSWLNLVVECTGAVVVVSSTWRLHQSVEHLQSYLDRAGFTGRVIDVTPDLHVTPDFYVVEGRDVVLPQRGEEIQLWLNAHPEVTSFVAIDDDGDRGPLLKDRWILVKDGWFEGGMKVHHAAQAIHMLEQEVV